MVKVPSPASAAQAGPPGAHTCPAGHVTWSHGRCRWKQGGPTPGVCQQACALGPPAAREALSHMGRTAGPPLPPEAPSSRETPHFPRILQKHMKGRRGAPRDRPPQRFFPGSPPSRALPQAGDGTTAPKRGHVSSGQTALETTGCCLQRTLSGQKPKPREKQPGHASASSSWSKANFTQRSQAGDDAPPAPAAGEGHRCCCGAASTAGGDGVWVPCSRRPESVTEG